MSALVMEHASQLRRENRERSGMLKASASGITARTVVASLSTSAALRGTSSTEILIEAFEHYALLAEIPDHRTVKSRSRPQPPERQFPAPIPAAQCRTRAGQITRDLCLPLQLTIGRSSVLNIYMYEMIQNCATENSIQITDGFTVWAISSGEATPCGWPASDHFVFGSATEAFDLAEQHPAGTRMVVVGPVVGQYWPVDPARQQPKKVS